LKQPLRRMPGTLPREMVCRHMSEPDWFEVREAINEQIKKEKLRKRLK